MHQQLAGHPSGLRLRSRLAMNKTQTSALIPPTVPENKGERQCGRGILSIPFYRIPTPERLGCVVGVRSRSHSLAPCRGDRSEWAAWL